MFSQFLAYRRGAIYNKNFCGSQKRSLEPSHLLQKRAQDKATVLADLLLNNCSVAIQDVYQEDAIPLPSSVLVSYSSAASVLAANPTTNTNLFAPTTASIGTGTGVPVPTGISGGGSGGSGGTKPKDSGASSPAGGRLGAVFSALLGVAVSWYLVL